MLPGVSLAPSSENTDGDTLGLLPTLLLLLLSTVLGELARRVAMVAAVAAASGKGIVSAAPAGVAGRTASRQRAEENALGRTGT
jgi:hypothetical protein